MTSSEYEGPTFGVLPQLGTVIWQYGYRQPDGTVLDLSAPPTRTSPRLVRRPLVPAQDWREVEVSEA